MSSLIQFLLAQALLGWSSATFLLIVVAILLIFIFYPEKFQKWASMIAWAGSRVIQRWEYFAIKTEVESDINSFVSRMSAKTGIFLPRIKLLWTAKDQEEIVWEDSEAIIVMRDRKHKKKNVVHAVYFFTAETILKKSKRHLSKSQRTALDLFSTLKILEAESAAAVEQFMGDYFSPLIAQNDNVRSLTKQFTHIERGGLYFTILIRELSTLGIKVFLEKPTAEVIKEVGDLILFLENFSNRQTGSTTTADTFIGKYTRCAIKIVSSKQSRDAGNIYPHKERILSAIKSRLENIYIIGRSDDGNEEFIHDVVDSIIKEVPDVEMTDESHFVNQINIQGKFKSNETCLIQLHNPSAVKYIYESGDTIT